MKKLTCILFAVIAMVFVSCGGKSDNSVKPADPSITYNITEKDFGKRHYIAVNDCFEVKNVGVREQGTKKYENDDRTHVEFYEMISASVTVEMIKEPTEKMVGFEGQIELFDKNYVKIDEAGCRYNGISKKGDILTFDGTTSTPMGSDPSNISIDKVKYVRLNICGYVDN